MFWSTRTIEVGQPSLGSSPGYILTLHIHLHFIFVGENTDSRINMKGKDESEFIHSLEVFYT